MFHATHGNKTFGHNGWMEPESRLRYWLLALLIVAWLVPGLVGHQPWKSDDAYSFGITYHFLQNGEWLVPTLAGEPALARPPFYYWVSAATASLFAPWLPLHDGARIASGIFIALALALLGLAARNLYGRGAGFPAALILIGCLGFLVRAHEMVAETALVFALAASLAGLSWAFTRPVAGGVLWGTGMGTAFLSSGMPGLLIPAMTAAILPILFKPWRNRNYGSSVIVALLAAVPWLAVWPFLLWQTAPELFWQWIDISLHRLGASLPPGGIAANVWYYLEILPWFAWPALPLALWALWYDRKRFGTMHELQLPLVLAFAALALISLHPQSRDLFALPLLPPLALLATSAVSTLRRGASNALYWFGIMVFAFFAWVLWFYWFAMDLGIPARLSAHLTRLQPGYTGEFRLIPFVIALVYTAVWVVVLTRLKRSKERPIIVWAAGITMVWGVLMSLFVAWVDTGKSYRQVAQSISNALPDDHGCVAGANIGHAQRAMLHYYDGMIVHPVKRSGDADACNWLLVQTTTEKAPRLNPGEEWRLIWEGNRSGERQERFMLFQRRGT